MEEENEDKTDLNSQAAMTGLFIPDDINDVDAVCQNDNSRFLDELSVANQLMALAGASDIYKSENQVNVDFYSSMPYSYRSLNEADNLDVRPEHVPLNDQEQILLEHSYAISRVHPDEENKEKQEQSYFDLPHLPVPLIINIEDTNLPIKKISCINKNRCCDVKESPNESKINVVEFDHENADTGVQHYIHTKNISKQLRSTDLHPTYGASKQSSESVSVQNVSETNSSLTSNSLITPGSSVKLCSSSEDKEIKPFSNDDETDAFENESIMSPIQTRNKKKAALIREKINKTNLKIRAVKRKSYLGKSNNKKEKNICLGKRKQTFAHFCGKKLRNRNIIDNAESNVTGQKKTALDSDKSLKSSIKLHNLSKNESVLSDNTKSLDNSDIEIDVVNIDHKKKPLSLLESVLAKGHIKSNNSSVKHNKLGKNSRLLSVLPKTINLVAKTKIISYSSNEKKKKSSSFFKDTNSSSKLSSEDSKELVYCKNTNQSAISTKSQKKKTLKKETVRFSLNEDEPPLFSQPDMMIKVNTDYNGKKEVKEEETKKYVCHDSVNNTLKHNGDYVKEVKETEMDLTCNSEKESEIFFICDSVKEAETDVINNYVKDLKETKKDLTATHVEDIKEIERYCSDFSENVVKGTEIDFANDTENKEKESEKEVDNCVKEEKNKRGNLNDDFVKEAEEIAVKEVENSKEDVTDFATKEEEKTKNRIDCSMAELFETKQDITTEIKKTKDIDDSAQEVKETMVKENTVDSTVLGNADKIIEINTLFGLADTSCHVNTKQHTKMDCLFDDEVSSLSENAMKVNDLTSFVSMTFGHENAFKIKHKQPVKNVTSVSLESEEKNYDDKEITNLYIDISRVENDFDENCKQSDIPKTSSMGIQPKSVQSKYRDESHDAKEEENFDNKIKPERKSRRLIKKKEFFEYVLEPPITPPPAPIKKKITQKQKTTKMKTSQKRKSSASELEESSDEDDPYKLWCICRRPHNNRFMIQCDTCEDWFHGSCVGVTKQQGCQLEKQKKEWKCPTCRNKDNKSPEDKSDEKETPKDIIKKLNMTGKKISHKPEHKIDNKENSMSQKSNFKTTKCSVSCVDLREDMPVEDEADRKIKSLQQKIQEQIDALSNKSKVDAVSTKPSSSSSSVQQKQQQIPISRALFTNAAEKDSLNKETKASNAPSSDRKKPSTILKKREIKHLPKKRLNCVQCQNTTAAFSCYCSFDCIEKHVAECLKSIQESTGSDKDINTQRLVVFDRFKGNVITGEKRPTVAEIIPWLKENPSFMIACSSNSTHDSKQELPLKKDYDSSSNLEKRDDLTKVNIRINVKKTLKNILMDRCKNCEDIILPEEEIRKIAMKIEEELFAQFKDTNLKYRTKYRSLMFNIKDPRNQGLFRKILRGEISPDQVVHMTATELASVELSKWREQEMQHHLDMIKRMQLEQQKSGGSHIKKTHKGEVEIEDDFTTIIEQDVLKSVFKNEVEDNLAGDKEEQDSAKDTTQLHRSHLFDLNCKICTGKVLPPPDESTPKKLRVAHSISVDVSSPNASQITEKSISHIAAVTENSLLEIFEKKSPLSISDEESSDQELPSTCISGFSEKETITDNAFKTTISVWKGFIFMQDIAKFVTSAYKVSGQTDNLHVDLPDTIQVCGRIIPDQVWDYLGKIKQSGNKELIIIQFQAANHEEAVTYNTFYSYLNSRKRYGVVSNYSKKIKDFYIVPLPTTSPVPTVLMPFDGPGLPSPRPHLLLGVIVRHRSKQTAQINMPKQVSKEDIEIEGSYTPPFESRSYTPPLPPQLPDNDIPEVYSECRSSLSETTSTSLEDVKRSPLSNITEEDKPYDPEQDVLTLNSDWLKEKSINQKENENILSFKNLEEHKKLLDALTKQVEETDREVSALKHLVSNPETNNSSEDFPNLSSKSVDITSVTETGMTSFLDLPSNLQEILNSVRLKSTDKDMRSNTKGDIDMRISSLNVLSKSNNKSVFGLQNISLHKLNEPLTISEDKSSSLGATPPPPDDDNDKPSISYPSDPRIKLRMSYQDAKFKPDEQSSFPNKTSIIEHSTNVTQLLKISDQVNTYHSKNFTTPISGTLLPINYHHFREPPPPGIEPSELQSEDLYSLKTIDLPDNSAAPPLSPQPSQFANSSVIHDTHSISAGFPPPAISFQPHLPPVFPPPQQMKPFPHSLAIQSSFAPLPTQTLPSEDTMKEQWSSAQQSGYPHEGKEWSGRTSSWNDSYSSERSRDFRRDQSFKRGNSSNNPWERPHRYNRGNWHKRSLRGHKFDNRRGKRVYPYRKKP